MMKLVLIPILISFTSSAFAGAFQFSEGKCGEVSSIENTLSFVIGENSFTSQVDVALVFSEAPASLPKMRLIFRQHSPSQATVMWKSIVSSRRNLGLFRPEIETRVQLEEARPFEMVRVGEDAGSPIFETPFLTLERSQDMVALFLSQNDMEIQVPSPEGPMWTAKISLQNTDASFRAMASKCYPEKVQGYLKPSGERASMESPRGYSNAALHFSDGYGLTAFTFIKSELPPQLQTLQWPSENEQVYLQTVGEVLRLVNLKRATAQSLDEALHNPEYVELESVLAEKYQNIENLYSRYTSLTTPSTGVIDVKMAERDALIVAIADVNTQIQNLTQTEAGQAEQLSTADAALQPFLEQLDLYNTTLTTQNGRLEEIKTSLETLTLRLEEDQALLAGRDFGSVTVDAEGPWSLEEIDRRQQSNRDLDQKIQTVVLLKQILESLLGELAILVQKSQEHEAAFVAYNKLVGDEAALKRQVSTVNQWLITRQKNPAMGEATENQFSVLHSEAEALLLESLAGQPRVYIAERDYYKAFFTTLESQFISQKGDAVLVAPVLSQLLCHPDILMNPLNRKTNCLTPDEAIDDKIVEAFFEAMPPTQKDTLLASIAKQKNNDGLKSQILLAEFMRERASADPIVRAPFETWLRIRHNVWRWATMQKKVAALDVCGADKPADPLPNEIYSAAFYEKVFQCEMTLKSNQLAERDQALAALSNLQPLLEQAKSSRDIVDEEFSRLSAAFVNVSMQRLANVGEQGDLTRLFTECVLPLQAADVCSQSISGGVVSAQSAIDQQSAIYLDTVRALVLNINARISLLNDEHAWVTAEMDRIRAEQSTFIVQNNIAALQLQKSDLEKQLVATKAAISQLTTSTTTLNGNLNAFNQSLGLLQQEAQDLTGQLYQLVGEIRQILPSYEPHCAQIRPGVAQLQKLDAELFKLLAPGAEIPETAVVYSSCQMSNLESYLPPAVTRGISVPERLP